MRYNVLVYVLELALVECFPELQAWFQQFALKNEWIPIQIVNSVGMEHANTVDSLCCASLGGYHDTWKRTTSYAASNICTLFKHVVNTMQPATWSELAKCIIQDEEKHQRIADPLTVLSAAIQMGNSEIVVSLLEELDPRELIQIAFYNFLHWGAFLKTRLSSPEPLCQEFGRNLKAALPNMKGPNKAALESFLRAWINHYSDKVHANFCDLAIFHQVHWTH